MRIMITGATGKLGHLLYEKLHSDHEIIGTSSRENMSDVQMDVTDADAVKAVFNHIVPDLVIHTAAWTDVEGCAKDPEKALLINANGARNVAQASATHHAKIMHISTNEVFDGMLTNRLYREYDACNPINPYARSKRRAEIAVLHHNPRHVIIRTSWLFAHGGKNFIQAILGAADSGKKLRIVADEIANPTYTSDLADAVVQVIDKDLDGMLHLVNDGAASRYEFGRYALNQAGYTDTPIEKIKLSDWERASTPPQNAGLENRVAASHGITLRPWQDAVDAFLQHEGLLQESVE